MNRFLTFWFWCSTFCFPVLADEIHFTPADETVCDVLVVGGGTAGVPAAVQSARVGAKTVLVELTGTLGGTTTNAGVKYPGLFHAWGKQIIAGIGWELVQKAVALNGDEMPNFEDPNLADWRISVPVNPLLYALLAEEMCVEAGVELRYFETPCQMERQSDPNAVKEKGNWKVTTAVQGEFRTIYCREIIDCTGNGNAAKMAGATLMRGEETQPGSIFYWIESGIDFSKVDWNDFNRRFSEAQRDGRLQPQDMVGGLQRFLTRPRPAGNRTYVYHADNSSGKLRTEANVTGHASILRSLRFVKTLPGGENARLVAVSAETGVRETFRVQGKYVITLDDYRTGRVFEDSVCFAYYPIDIHRPDGVRPEQLKRGTVATVPYRSLIVENVPHFFVAGRCVSCDRETGSALRVQSICMATGQAAGMAAALAAKHQIRPEEVNIEELKSELKNQGAIVP